MSAAPVRVTYERNVATVTLDCQPTRNALNLEIINALEKIFQDLSADSELRAVVLCGAGEDFCSGADLNWMRDAAQLPEEQNEAQARSFANVLLLLNQLHAPVIVLAQGCCYGGGAGLCCAADITLATNYAKFCFSEARLGLTPATISPYVAAAIGLRQARRLFLTSEVFDAVRAKEMGLVHAVHPDSELNFATATLLALLRRNAPGTVSANKRLLTEISGVPLSQELAARTAKILVQRRGTDEAQEGIAAFLEKRNPSWKKDD